MPEVRCAARTKKATSIVTALQAGQEPVVIKVRSSTNGLDIVNWISAEVEFLHRHTICLFRDVSTLTLVLTPNACPTHGWKGWIQKGLCFNQVLSLSYLCESNLLL